MIFRHTLIILTLNLLLLTSCEEVDFKTEGQAVGEKLDELVQKEKISLATTHDEWEKPFKINGQVIQVGLTYYNLDKLVKYEISTYDDPSRRVLELYFDGFN